MLFCALVGSVLFGMIPFFPQRFGFHDKIVERCRKGGLFFRAWCGIACGMGRGKERSGFPEIALMIKRKEKPMRSVRCILIVIP